jgi:hypothetical protein
LCSPGNSYQGSGLIDSNLLHELFFAGISYLQKITSAISNYWWGSAVDGRGMHWKKWSELTLPKPYGGMGFRDIKKFNLAMLGKQGWCFMTNPTSLCARVLKGKYYPTGDFMSASRKKNSSHTWRAILTWRSVLDLGLIRHIDNGTSTNIWTDNWIPNGIGSKRVCRPERATSTKVSELLSVAGSWDEEALDLNLVPMDANAVRCIPLG